MTGDRVYLGIDGGGSKTDALALDAAGRVLGTGQGAGSNHQTLGLETAIDHIRTAAAAALNGRRAAHGVFCLSGADLPSDFARLEPALHALDLCDTVTIHNDLAAVFHAGSTRPYGLAIVCGTGFNAGGTHPDGRAFRLPALGPVTGDQAGGSVLGLDALRAAFRGWDGRGPATALQAALLRHFNLPDMPTLADALDQRIDSAQITALAPLVFATADAGDAVAAGLIRDQGREIGITLLAIARRLDLLDTPCEAILGGSVVQTGHPRLMDAIAAVVEPEAPRLTLKRLDVPPVVGAALLALDRDGLRLSEEARVRLSESLR